MTDERKPTGVAPQDLVDAALKIARQEATAAEDRTGGEHAIAALKDELDKLCDGLKVSEINRDQIVSAIEIIRRYISTVLSEPLCLLEDGEELRVEHKAVSILVALSNALQDLEDGIVDPVLQLGSSRQGRMLTRRQAASDQLWVNSVLILQCGKGLKSRVEAERQFAKALNKNGYTRRGAKVTAEMLKKLADHPRKRR